MVAIAEVWDGGTIVDAPCASGVAIRALRPERDVRYRAFDLSDAMVARARRCAERLGLAQIEVGKADSAARPVEDATVDLFLSYFGLYCFPDPDGAICQAARCLRPGGRLVGSSIVGGEPPLDRLQVRPGVGAPALSGLRPRWSAC